MPYEQNLKQYLASTFNSIKRLNLYGAYKKLLDEDLEAELILPPIKNEELSWSVLYSYVEKASKIRKWTQKEGAMLVNLLHSRKKREDEAKIFFDKHELPFFYALENLNAKEICNFISTNYIKDKSIIFPQVTSWNQLFDEVKRFEALDTRHRNAIYSVLMFKGIYRKKQAKKHNDAFQTCSFCWRPVPMRLLGNKGDILCQFHQYRAVEKSYEYGKAYERALKIEKEKNLDSQTFQQKIKIVKNNLYSLTPISKEQKHNIRNWLLNFYENPLQAKDTMPWKMTWPDFAHLTSSIPHITAAIEQDVTKNTTDLVSILCPIHPAANEEERGQLEALNSIWEQNYFLFVPELAKAEIWFRQCYISHGKMFFPA